jgi:uracil-DNA glycosylase family 4
VNPGPAEAEALQYLADLGWTDLYLSPTARTRAPARVSAQDESPEKEKASGKEEGAKTFGKEDEAATFSSSPLEPRSPEDGAAALVTLEALALEASTCRRCKLCTTRNKVVFASGDPRARLMLVGEGPGAEEDKQGLPFVGPAGELLNRILEAIGLARDAVYVANVVKCRPPGNREPEPDEAGACRSYLSAQIDLVRPELIVALGRVAAQSLLGTDSSLTRLRGDWHAVQGVPVRVTYHPAALLRNAAYKRPTWEDMQLVRDRLKELAERSPGSQRADQEIRE